MWDRLVWLSKQNVPELTDVFEFYECEIMLTEFLSDGK